MTPGIAVGAMAAISLGLVNWRSWTSGGRFGRNFCCIDIGGHPFGTDGTRDIERWVNVLAFRDSFGSSALRTS